MLPCLHRYFLLWSTVTLRPRIVRSCCLSTSTTSPGSYQVRVTLYGLGPGHQRQAAHGRQRPGRDRTDEQRAPATAAPTCAAAVRRSGLRWSATPTHWCGPVCPWTNRGGGRTSCTPRRASTAGPLAPARSAERIWGEPSPVAEDRTSTRWGCPWSGVGHERCSSSRHRNGSSHRRGSAGHRGRRRCGVRLSHERDRRRAEQRQVEIRCPGRCRRRVEWEPVATEELP